MNSKRHSCSRNSNAACKTKHWHYKNARRVLSMREDDVLQQFSDCVETESKRRAHLEGEVRAKDAVIAKQSSQVAALKNGAPALEGGLH